MNCEGKQGFTNFHDAQTVADRMTSRHYGRMMVYRCSECGNVHVGFKANRHKKFKFKNRRK